MPNLLTVPYFLDARHLALITTPDSSPIFLNRPTILCTYLLKERRSSFC